MATAVLLSANGGTLAVGSYFEDSAGTGFGANPADNGAASAGAVDLYR